MKSKKGFTLIELLAVIVILGLLMAIAIPSVTRYIIQSRKKTVVSSIDSYISALATSVNDQEYKFTAANTIYAIPIECISLEKGGSSPFGEWHQANNEYWAYVLVQYDSENFSYKYGFTFKDSAGYGMNPIGLDKIKDKGRTQIEAGISLNKPVTGLAVDVLEKDKWDGFIVDDNTQLVVLEAEAKDKLGDGKNTCTLMQVGENYAEVEQDKIDRLKHTCRVTSGSGEKVGDIITCDTENFYVIGSDSSTVTVLSKYNISLESSPRQNKNAKHILFSSGTYWGTTEGKQKYGNNYPVYVFDENSNLYPYVLSYHEYLKEQFGLENSQFGLITTQKLDELGCERLKWTCSAYPWIVSETYWTGSASGEAYVWCANGNNYFCNVDWSYDKGIRPVITISRSDIKF